jgi:hypothetical protein
MKYILVISTIGIDGKLYLSTGVFPDGFMAANSALDVYGSHNHVQFKSTMICTDGRQFHWNGEGVCPYSTIE